MTWTEILACRHGEPQSHVRVDRRNSSLAPVAYPFHPKEQGRRLKSCANLPLLRIAGKIHSLGPSQQECNSLTNSLVKAVSCTTVATAIAPNLQLAKTMDHLKSLVALLISQGRHSP